MSQLIDSVVVVVVVVIYSWERTLESPADLETLKCWREEVDQAQNLQDHHLNTGRFHEFKALYRDQTRTCFWGGGGRGKVEGEGRGYTCSVLMINRSTAHVSHQAQQPGETVKGTVH